MPSQTTVSFPARLSIRLALWRLLQSMRFAISLLVCIAIASLLGSVIVQNDTPAAYINQFGLFWVEVFTLLGLFSIYAEPWFLLLLAFLTLSTALCVSRNTPKILREYGRWRLQWGAAQLQRIPIQQRVQTVASPLTEIQARATQVLRAQGYTVRARPQADGVLLLARRGRWQGLGYIAAHLGIVVIGIGALLDSQLWVQVPLWLGQKAVYQGLALGDSIPASARISSANPSYRGSIALPEGGTSASALLNKGHGVLVQELPFAIELERFYVEHHINGMPKQFISEIKLHDLRLNAQGQRLNPTPQAAQVAVNRPAHFQGVSIYQSSFSDGGSRIELVALPLFGRAQATQPIVGVVGEAQVLPNTDSLRLELTDFRLINVENTTALELSASARLQMGSNALVNRGKNLQNVGPAVSYKLRDASGQAREYKQYTQPITLEGQSVLVLGMRDDQQSQMRFVRLPVDPAGGISELMALRSVLSDPDTRLQAVQRFAAGMSSSGQSRQLLEQSAQRVLDVYLRGFEPAARTTTNTTLANNAQPYGLVGVVELLADVPEAERASAAQIFLRILRGTLWQAWQIARAELKLPAAQDNNAAQNAFLDSALTALSDMQFLQSPYIFTLTGFNEIKASVLQVTRAPGQAVVYLGCLLLVIGIFIMLFVRSYQVWLQLSASTLQTSVQTSAPHGQGLIALLSAKERSDDQAVLPQLIAHLIAAQVLIPVASPDSDLQLN